MADAFELRLILRISLDAETSGEDELADSGAETGEEGVEGLYQRDRVSASLSRKTEGQKAGKKQFKALPDCPFYRTSPAALRILQKKEEKKQKRERERG